MKKALTIVLSLLLVFTSIPLSFIGVAASEVALGENLAANFKYESDGSGAMTWTFDDSWNRNDTSVSAHGGMGWKIPHWNGWSSDHNLSGRTISIKATGLEKNTRYQFGFSNGGHFYMVVSEIYVADDSTKKMDLSTLVRTKMSTPVYTNYAWEDVSVDFSTNDTDTDYIIVLKATESKAGSTDELAFADLRLQKYIALGDNLAANYKYEDNVNGAVTWTFDDSWNRNDTTVSAHGGMGWKIPHWNGWSSDHNLSGRTISIKATGLEKNTRYQFAFSNGGHYRIGVTKVYVANDSTKTLELSTQVRTAVANPNNTTYSWDDVTTNFTTNGTDTDYVIVLQGSTQRGSGDSELAFADLRLQKHLSNLCVVSASKEGNGTAGVSAATSAIGDTVTFTATPNHMELFLGWYSASGKFLSSQTNYEHTVTSSVTNLTAKFTSFTTSSDNLVKEHKKDDGITLTYTGWYNELSGSSSRYGGYGLKVNNGNFTSQNGVELKVTGLKPNTAYRFGYSNAGDHRMVLHSVTSTTGKEAYITKSINPTNSGWISADNTIITGDETDYILKITAYNQDKDISHREGMGWSDATMTDFALIEASAYEINLAANYTNANGDVTWENTDAWGGDTNIDTYNRSVNGGLAWSFGMANAYANNPGYIYIKASGLEAETEYDFSYIYAMDYCIYLDSVQKPDRDTISGIETTDIALNKGDNAHQVSFGFTTEEAGDYIITLKSAKDWKNTSNWTGATLSDLVLKKNVPENLAVTYTNANGHVTWVQEEAGAHLEELDQHDGYYNGYSWCFGLPETNTSTIPYAPITIHADGLEANSRYEFSYLYDRDFEIKLDAVLDEEGEKVANVTAATDTYLNTGKTHQVKFEFVTTFAGDYDIVLKGSKAWPVEPCDWGHALLSDLSLIKKVNKVDNLAEAWTHANGHVNWTENSQSRAEDGSEGVNGGYSWRFGIGETNNADASKIAYVTITTDELKADTLYDFSYVYSKDFKILMDSIKNPSGETVDMAEMTDEALTAGDRAHKMSTRFVADEAGVYTITLKMAKGWNNVNNSWDCALLSDLTLLEVGSEPLSGKVSFGTGGTATSSEDWYFAKGTKVEVIATPFTGNTFEGWYNAAGTKVSGDATYRFVANEAFDLTAKFTGHNMASTDYLLLNGLDGTFETGDIGEWTFKDTWSGDSSEWCYATPTASNARNGNKALEIKSRHRSAYLKLDDLKLNTDYYMSFYLKLPYAEIEEVGYVGTCTLANEATTFYQVYRGTWNNWIYDGSGWHRVDIHFNSGDYDEVTLTLGYGVNDWSTFLYMDDFTLSEYVAKDSLKNGSVDQKADWAGDYTVTSDQKAELAAAGDRIQQAVKLEKQSSYTLTFKAKGKVEAGAARVDVFDPAPKDWLTSQSVTETDGDWKDYSITFYSGVHAAAQIYFEALEAGALIDDVVLTKNDSRIGSIVEKVDFETERFALNNSNTNVWEIYEATDADDANVYSGNKSLHFKFDQAEANTEYLLDEAYLSNEILQGGTYRLTTYVKMVDGKDSGSIKLSPDYTGDFAGGELKMFYTPTGDGWQKVEMIFTNTDKITIKTVISNVVGVGATYCDFYIDDITLELIRPFVTDTDVETPYAALVHNVLENEGFEKKVSDADWKDLPEDTTSIRSGDADVQKKYLRVDSGTFYVLPVKVKANTSYTLAASLRGKNTDGWIGISSSADGKILYTTQDGKDLSKIDATSKDWTRKGFSFSTEENGMVYLVMSCSEGYFDVDNVMLYESHYGLDWDPNVYDKPASYDYEAVDSATCVINGGFGEQPHLLNKEEGEDTTSGDSPLTGDSLAYPITLGVIALLAAALVVLLLRKRQSAEGGNSK